MFSELVLVAEYVTKIIEVEVCCSNSEQYAVGVYVVSVAGLRGGLATLINRQTFRYGSLRVHHAADYRRKPSFLCAFWYSLAVDHLSSNSVGTTHLVQRSMCLEAF